MFRRDHALGEVIDLLKAFAPGNRQLAGVPEEFQRRLRGVPVPPAAGDMILALHIAGHDRTMIADAGIGFLEGLIETLPLPPGPVLADSRLAAHEPVFPIGKEGRGDDRGVMGPVLEKRAVLFDEMLEVPRLVGLIAGKENLVVGALDPLDAVDLNEAEIVDQVVEPLTPKRLRRRAGQALPFEKYLARQGVGNRNRHKTRLGYVRGLFNRRLIIPHRLAVSHVAMRHALWLLQEQALQPLVVSMPPTKGHDHVHASR